MDFLSDFSVVNWLLIVLGAFIIGLSKAGLKGIDMMNVAIMAIVFGGKTGQYTGSLFHGWLSEF